MEENQRFRFPVLTDEQIREQAREMDARNEEMRKSEERMEQLLSIKDDPAARNDKLPLPKHPDLIFMRTIEVRKRSSRNARFVRVNHVLNRCVLCNRSLASIKYEIEEEYSPEKYNIHYSFVNVQSVVDGEERHEVVGGDGWSEVDCFLRARKVLIFVDEKRRGRGDIPFIRIP